MASAKDIWETITLSHDGSKEVRRNCWDCGSLSSIGGWIVLSEIFTNILSKKSWQKNNIWFKEKHINFLVHEAVSVIQQISFRINRFYFWLINSDLYTEEILKTMLNLEHHELTKKSWESKQVKQDL